MSQISMFKAGGKFKGAYNSGTAYHLNEIVQYAGFAYIAEKEVPAGIIPTNTSYWSLVAPQGEYAGISATTATTVSATNTGSATGTRKYWYGVEWTLNKTSASNVELEKVYQNCNCNCNCLQACKCPANQPNMGNCTWDTGDGLKCNCACLLQSDCNYVSGYCNCTAICNDGNCYF